MTPREPQDGHVPQPVSSDAHLDLAALDRYLAGQASAEEDATVEAWAAADPAHAVQLAAFRGALAPAPVPPPLSATEASRVTASVLSRTHRGSALAASERAVVFPPHWPRVGESRTWTRMVGGIAAGLVLTAGAFAAGRLVSRRSSVQPFREFVSRAGSRTTVVLRDGTQLVLGPGTLLRVPADFGQSTRTVELDGKALFAVVHDARHPFAVRTARVTVRDVGTTFAVSAYTGDAEERVAVAEGQVAVGGAMLSAHDLASITATGAVAIRRGADLAPYFAWAQGRLVFDETPLRDVARDIERAFDLDIVLADSTLAGRPITAALDGGSADEVLDAVARAVDARYERSGRHVVIRQRLGAAGRSGPAARAPLETARADARE